MFNNFRLQIKIPILIEAIKSCSDKNEIQIKATWKYEKVFTIHLQCRINEQQVDSWGADKKEILALGKALMEMIERIHINHVPVKWKDASGEEFKSDQLLKDFPIFRHFLSTSSGMSAHLSDTLSTMNSINELFERHVITKALLEGLWPLRESIDSFYWTCSRKFIALKVHRLPESGFLYGTACSNSLKEALRKASLELAAPIAWSKNQSNLTNLDPSERPAKKIRAYHLSQTKLPPILANSDSSKTVKHLDKKHKVYVGKVPILPQFKDIPSLVITRAFSPTMQPFHYNPLAEGPINGEAVDLVNLNIQSEYNVIA